MLTYRMAAANRKELVKRISELTEIPSKYMGVPGCGYQIGRYTVAKDGTLTVDDIAADTEMLAQLIEEGLIAGELPGTAESVTETAEETVTEGMEETVTEEENVTEATENNVTAEESVTETAEENVTEESEDEEEPPTDKAILRVSVPMANHTGVSLRNLINLIYSRGRLLRKATGGSFEVEEGLIEALEDDACTITKEAFMRVVADHETEHGKSIYGIEMSPEEITFIFGTVDTAHADAFTKLAGLMNRQVLTQKRIRAKEVDDSNEKYALRTWLLRIGMTGPEYKEARKILMENLGGHTAFRTPEEAERAKQKNLEKRLALKEAKAAGADAAGSAEAAQDTPAAETADAEGMDTSAESGSPQD